MKRLFVIGLFCVYTFGAYAEGVLDLNTALRNTYTACVGINDELHELKVLAGINTAVTAVGTGAGVGAVATGFAKEQTDKEAEEFERYIQELSKSAEQQTEQPTRINITAEELHALFSEKVDVDNLEEELENLNKKSKTLGDWRTGLMAGNTATNIVSAVIANKTKTNTGLQGKIDTCVFAVKKLSDSMLNAKIEGFDISEAQSIYNACRDYEYVDISPITKRGTGAMVASSVGAVAGGIGTITSGITNSDDIRNDNSDEGKQREKNLNTASNVLAVGATAASATATVFNATQISAIKKVADIAEKCTEVLK